MKAKTILIFVWIVAAVVIVIIIKNIINANKVIKESKEQQSIIKVTKE